MRKLKQHHLRHQKNLKKGRYTTSNHKKHTIKWKNKERIERNSMTMNKEKKKIHKIKDKMKKMYTMTSSR